MEERLKGLQNLYANLKTIPEPRPIQNGDFVILDYEATMDGKPLEEGKAIDYTVEVGKRAIYPGLRGETGRGETQRKKKRSKSPFPKITDTKNGQGSPCRFTSKSKRSRRRSFPRWMMSLQRILEVTLPSMS